MRSVSLTVTGSGSSPSIFADCRSASFRKPDRAIRPSRVEPSSSTTVSIEKGRTAGGVGIGRPSMAVKRVSSATRRGRFGAGVLAISTSSPATSSVARSRSSTDDAPTTTSTVPPSTTHSADGTSKWANERRSSRTAAVVDSPGSRWTLAKPRSSSVGRSTVVEVRWRYTWTTSLPARSPVFVRSTCTVTSWASPSPRSRRRSVQSKVVYDRPWPNAKRGRTSALVWKRYPTYMPSRYSTWRVVSSKFSAEGKIVDAGNVSARRPPGSASPTSTSQIADPAAWPPRYASTTAAGRSAQGNSTGAPLTSTTTVRGLAAHTAATRASWSGGRASVVRSKPSASSMAGRPTNTTATSLRPASSAASRIDPRPASPVAGS